MSLAEEAAYVLDGWVLDQVREIAEACPGELYRPWLDDAPRLWGLEKILRDAKELELADKIVELWEHVRTSDSAAGLTFFWNSEDDSEVENALYEAFDNLAGEI